MGDLEEMNKERVRAMLAAVDASLATGAYQATDGVLRCRLRDP
jgi:hypothetical protein